MKSWLSVVLSLFGLVLLGGIIYSFLPAPVDVDAATAKRQTLRVTVDEDGKTRIREKYVVSAPLAGRLLRIGLDAGDAVIHNDTVVAVIEPRNPELLDARSLAQAEAQVQAAETQVRRADPILEQARIAQGNAEADLARARRAAPSGAVTTEELERVEARFRSASEELRIARYAKEIAEFELQQAEAALLVTRPGDDDQTADSTNTTNGNFVIRSPIDGRVLRVLQESAAVVTAGTQLLELGDPSDLEIVIDVLSSDAIRIFPGTNVVLEHWGGSKPLNGRVRLVEPSGFTKVSTLGVEEQRVNVIVDIVEPAAERTSLGDGFRVEARIVVADIANSLVVPASALFRTSSGWAVFRDVGSRARQVAVEVGEQNPLEAAILSGLDEGDRVIVHPSDRLHDGTSIRVR